MFIITPILYIKKWRYKFKSLVEGDTENKLWRQNERVLEKL